MFVDNKKKEKKRKTQHQTPKTTSFLSPPPPSQQAADKLPLSSHLVGAVIYHDSERTEQFLMSYKG